MGVRADVVGENAVPWKFVAQDVQNVVRREICAIRPQRPIEQTIGAFATPAADQSLADASIPAIASIAASRSQALFQRNFNPSPGSAASVLMWMMGVFRAQSS